MDESNPYPTLSCSLPLWQQWASNG